jgi:hypothetical protein
LYPILPIFFAKKQDLQQPRMTRGEMGILWRGSVCSEEAWSNRIELPGGADSIFPGQGERLWLPEDSDCRAAGPWPEGQDWRKVHYMHHLL